MDRLDIGAPINPRFFARLGFCLTAIGLLMLGGALHITEAKLAHHAKVNQETVAMWEGR